MRFQQRERDALWSLKTVRNMWKESAGERGVWHQKEKPGWLSIRASPLWSTAREHFNHWSNNKETQLRDPPWLGWARWWPTRSRRCYHTAQGSWEKLSRHWDHAGTYHTSWLWREHGRGGSEVSALMCTLSSLFKEQWEGKLHTLWKGGN